MTCAFLTRSLRTISTPCPCQIFLASFLLLSGCNTTSPVASTPPVEKKSAPISATSEPVAEPVPDSNEDAGYPVRLIEASKLQKIERQWAGETTFADHSFTLNTPVMGDVYFVASQGNIDGLDMLFLRWHMADGFSMPLIPDDDFPSWSFWDLNAVSFEDVNQDGHSPDVVVIAEYVTGTGPTGAQPFSVASVYLNNGGDTFTADAEMNRLLEAEGVSSVSEVRSQYK